MFSDVNQFYQFFRDVNLLVWLKVSLTKSLTDTVDLISFTALEKPKLYMKNQLLTIKQLPNLFYQTKTISMQLGVWMDVQLLALQSEIKNIGK